MHQEGYRYFGKKTYLCQLACEQQFSMVRPAPPLPWLLWMWLFVFTKVLQQCMEVYEIIKEDPIANFEFRMFQYCSHDINCSNSIQKQYGKVSNLKTADRGREYW